MPQLKRDEALLQRHANRIRTGAVLMIIGVGMAAANLYGYVGGWFGIAAAVALVGYGARLASAWQCAHCRRPVVSAQVTECPECGAALRR